MDKILFRTELVLFCVICTVQILFAQSRCPNLPTITDYDGNIYKTVQIGSQCWIAENLRVTHYADGRSILMGHEPSTTTAYCYYPDNNKLTVPMFGLLYNWAAIMDGAPSSDRVPSGVQGICPSGWHVPSMPEWDKLFDYMGSRQEFTCNGDKNNIAKALADNTCEWAFTDRCAFAADVAYEEWLEKHPNASEESFVPPVCCIPGEDVRNNNSSGFSARPAGWYSGYEDDEEMGITAYMYINSFIELWSTTQYGGGARSFWVVEANEDIDYHTSEKFFGLSVRCVKD